MNAMDHKVFFFLGSLTSLLQAININKHCTVNVLFTLAVFISLNLAGSFMRLEITVISSIRLDAEVFSQRIFSIVENRRLCINGTPWIWHLLEECVENAWEYWSVVIGLISIVCFLFAALPQIYIACQNGRVDQALSLGFLLCWIAGDLTNFIGCYLTNQLPIQIVTAIFYVNMDIIMISQFVYYKLKNQMTKCSKSLKNFCVTWIIVCIALCVILPCQLLLRNQDQSTVIARNNVSSYLLPFQKNSTQKCLEKCLVYSKL
uniref:PQ-loop repeat-containing protein 2 n=1 Tax=Calidris pygmaea TaxID=425635 RepID=A0A8C3JAY7_9CHAR